MRSRLLISSIIVLVTFLLLPFTIQSVENVNSNKSSNSCEKMATNHITGISINTLPPEEPFVTIQYPIEDQNVSGRVTIYGIAGMYQYCDAWIEILSPTDGVMLPQISTVTYKAGNLGPQAITEGKILVDIYEIYDGEKVLVHQTHDIVYIDGYSEITGEIICNYDLEYNTEYKLELLIQVFSPVGGELPIDLDNNYDNISVFGGYGVKQFIDEGELIQQKYMFKENCFPLKYKILFNGLLSTNVIDDDGDKRYTVCLPALGYNGTIEKVEIKIDEGDWELAEGTTSWSYVWDTRTVGPGYNGYHFICARSYDGIIYSKPDGFWVNVVNDSVVQINQLDGGFGISCYLVNWGNEKAYDVHWSIDVEPRSLGIVISGNHKEGMIAELGVNQTETIQSFGLRGIGLITITVQAADASKQATAFLLGPLVLRVSEL